LALSKITVSQRYPTQSGNVVIAIFAAVAMLGALNYGYSKLITGPAKGVQTITARTASEADIFSAAKILLGKANENLTTGDCDADGFQEMLPWQDPSGTPAPSGGGLIPSIVTASSKDQWGTTFGYCTWDHGSVTKAAGCGGGAALRRRGGDTKTEYVMALISAGQDRVFQTSCHDFVDANNDGTSDVGLIQKANGSDDLLVYLTYAEVYDAQQSGGGLGDVEDDACTPDSIGLMRYEQEVVQVCLEGGWTEIGANPEQTTTFTPVNNAPLNTQYTSNEISFSGFFGTRLASVDNGGTIILNGTAVGSSTQVKVGDKVAIRGVSSSVPETPITYTLSVSSVKRPWVVTTRLRTVHTITPSQASVTNMWVNGESGVAYSPTSTITITHSAGEDTAVMGTPSVSPATNFEITATTCTGIVRTPGQTCTVTVRAKASSTSSFNGLTATLTVPSSGQSNGGARNATIALTADALFPVTLSNNTHVNIQNLPEWSGGNAARWTQNRPKRVIIPAGVIIGSTNPTIPALQSGTGWSGALTITNNGSIQGAGGQFNVTSSSGVNGGGAAFLASQSGISLINNGTMWAGGGSGGQGGTGGNGTYQQSVQVFDPPSGWLYATSNPRSVWHHSYNTDSEYGYVTDNSLQIRFRETMVYCCPTWNPGLTSVVVGAYTYHKGAVRHYGTQFEVRRSYMSSQTVVGAGGAGGAGGVGQGYGQSSGTGIDGATGVTNAGRGGKGGTGGAWGQNGSAGIIGNAGDTAGGATGAAGGPAGYAIQNFGNVTLTGTGTRLGQ
jgi:hypothetical protein